MGEGSGTGETLAKVIIDDQRARAHNLPLLYLTGDKNRDVLPTFVQAAGLDLEPLQVYATRGSPSFLTEVRELFQRNQPLGERDCRLFSFLEKKIDCGFSMQIQHDGALFSLLHLPQNSRCRFYENT